MPEYRLDNGRVIRLGRQLASAGEGVISDVVGHPEWVAKIYHPHLPKRDVEVRGRKLRAMAAGKPASATQADGVVVLTWPLHTIHGPGDKVCGFVMRKIDTSTTVEIHNVSNPSDRAEPLSGAPQWPKNVTWLHLLNIARNLCRAVDTAHKAGAVIGDFNERNILVADTTIVTLVDCDSFQFRAGSSVYPCTVGRPEFIAPELTGVDLAARVRDTSSDLFVLAIHIHLLLMAGNHPYMRGIWTGRGEQPESPALTAEGHWAGGPNSKLKSHPAAPDVSMFPVAVRTLFERALGVGARQPAQRPSAAEWGRALGAITLTTCSRDKTHQYSNQNTSCPWCALTARQNKSSSATLKMKTTLPKPGALTRTTATTAVATPTGGRTATTTAPRPAPVTRPGARPGVAASSTPRKPTPKRADPVVTARRASDTAVGRLALAATVTCLVPWLVGHYLLRGSFLQVSSEVYNGQIRAWWPYFWAELRGGWALLWLLAAAFLLLRSWRGRAPSIALGVALLALACWVGPGAKESFARAEEESVAALSSTKYPFAQDFPVCGAMNVGMRDSEGSPVHTLWQMYVYSDSRYGGPYCTHIAVYRGWERLAALRLPDGVEFADDGRDMSVYFQDIGESRPTNWAFWNYDLNRVWLNAPTADGRVVSTNLLDAGNGGLALR